tara:strand:- start:62 stop:934 length:873 start_codon:yes stop_codon:yes gene_type:complete
MQEGHLRSVSNQKNGDEPSPFTQLKKTLGLKSADGKVLPDEDSWTRVTEQTWASLPRWPEGTKINEVADWSLTLNQFTVNPSNITTLTENVKTSQLDQFEINFLIKELENKTPFIENGEDDFNGTDESSNLDDLPFGPGNTENQTILLDTNTNSSTSIVAELDLLFGIFSQRVTSKGLPINSVTFNNMVVSSTQILADPDTHPSVRDQANAFVDAKALLIQGLIGLGNDVRNNTRFEQYRWSKDPNIPFFFEDSNKLSWRIEPISSNIELPKISAAQQQISQGNFIYTDY